jgi:hypothetical protein
MSATTTVRVDLATHEELKRLARHRNATVADTVARAVRLLRQEQMGRELAEAVADEERDWLEADTG